MGQQQRKPQMSQEDYLRKLEELSEEERSLTELRKQLSARAQMAGSGTHNRTYNVSWAHKCEQAAHESDVPNPLDEVQTQLHSDASGNVKKLQCLGKMCEKLAQIFDEDNQRKIDMQQQLETKMASLKEFAITLNRIPEVLKQYVLVRLGEIDVEDLTVLKKWITHDEATQVHKMLEAFRDEAIYERAIREVASRGNVSSSWQFTGSDGVASMKEYLFANSVGQPADGGLSADDGDDHSDQGSNVPDDESSAAAQHETKRKASHRQRKRQAKFWASMPRTPSSTTRQS